MTEKYDFGKQFRLSREDYLKKLDLLNWLRFFAIIQEAIKSGRQSILEVGPGEGTIKNVLSPFVKKYDTLDVNAKLKPTYRGDIRRLKNEVRGKYDCVVAADILEHIPFTDLKTALQNIYSYLKPGGLALITIPHRSHYLFLMTSKDHRPKVLRTPTLKRLMGRKVAIDPDHEWEIGDGHHSIKDVEAAMKRAGFEIEKREELIYVDFWVLKKIK